MSRLETRRPAAVAVLCWTLVALCMTFIFIMSAKEADESSRISGGLIERICELVVPGFAERTEAQRAETVEAMQGFVRKAAHFTVYALLGALTVQALFCHTDGRAAVILISFAVCVVYAVSDEVHQLFVPGRSGEVRDVLIDSLGAALGILFSYALTRLVRARRAGRHSRDAQ